MKRAIIYARVSTEKQAEEGLSIDSQIAACQRKADDLGASVVQVFRDDGISGTTDARPGFRAAIQRCAARDVDYLVCWSSSRFARDQFDAISYKGELARCGTRLVYASSSVDLRTQEGWLLDSLQQVMDENYSRQVSADTLRSMMKVASDGFAPGGRVPYGYQRVPAGDGRHNKLVPLEAEAAVVRLMFERAEQGVGAFLIARQLNLDGITHRGRPWAKNSVLYLLKNEVNMGNIIYGRFERKTRRERQPTDWVRVKAHTPLVEPGLFDRVQQAMSGRTPGPGGASGRAEHAFSGLLRCGCCGSSLQMTNGTGRGQRRYHYYACRAHNQGQPCTFKPVRADLFDPQLITELVDHVLSPSAIQAVMDDLDRSAAVWIKDRTKRRAAMVLELRRAEQKRDNILQVLEQLGQAAPALKPMLDRMGELAVQIRKLETSLTAIENEEDPVEARAPVTAAEASTMLRRAIAEQSDPKALRAWIGTIVDHVVVHTDSVVVHYRPDCLVHGDGRPVRSEYGWLPVQARLRTVVLPLRVVHRGRFRRAA